MNQESKVSRKNVLDMAQATNWDAMTKEDKEKALQKISAYNFDRIGFPATGRPVVKSKLALEKGTYGYYDPKTNEIYVNEKMLDGASTFATPDDKNDAKYQLFNTIFHEGYHAYQNDIVKHTEHYPPGKESPETLERWRENNERYSYLPDGYTKVYSPVTRRYEDGERFMYGPLYTRQRQEKTAFRDGNDNTDDVFLAPELAAERQSYERSRIKSLEIVTRGEADAQKSFGDDYDRKADLVVRQKYLEIKCRELAEQVLKAKQGPEEIRDCAELQRKINGQSGDMMPIILKTMTPDALAKKEVELEQLKQELSTLAKRCGINLEKEAKLGAVARQETTCMQTREQIQRTLDGRRIEIDQEVLALNALHREMGGPPRERGALLAEAASQYLGGEDNRLAMEKGALLLERETLDKERRAAERYGEQTGFATAVARHLPSWCQSAEMREYQAELNRLTEQEQQLAQREAQVADKQRSLEVRLQQPEAQQGVENILTELQRKEAERGAALEPLLARKAELDAERKDIVALSCTYRSSEKTTELQIQGDPLDAKNLAAQSTQIIAQLQGGAEQGLALARA